MDGQTGAVQHLMRSPSEGRVPA